MISEELRGIVSALYEKAKANQVYWVVASDLGVGGSKDDFVVSFASYSINIARNDDGDIFFGILNSKGDFVNRTIISPGEPDYPLFEHMLAIASRKVSGIDEALSTLKKALSQDGPVGLTNPPRIPDDDLPF